MINKAIVLGLISDEPFFRESASGTVANFTVMTEEKRDNGSGEEKIHKQWHRVVAFGKMSEKFEKLWAECASSGALVLVEGRLQTSKWTTKEGETRYKTEIIASNIGFVGSSTVVPIADVPGPESWGAKKDDADCPF